VKIICSKSFMFDCKKGQLNSSEKVRNWILVGLVS
jgi:hypothetical protein